MSGKYALIIGNTEYSDPGLAKLTAPSADAEDLARVLKDPKLCAFDEVKVSLNQPSSTVIEEIDEFFDQRKTEDLLVLYFSGHGIRDEFGSLHLAFHNTMRTRLRSTAVKADYVREAMDQSRSKRQVLILDCCNSGAFPQGTKAEVGGSMGMMTAFQGYGRYVLTASDATQFAWEGNQIIGSTDNSLFTHFLVQGLEGDADHDADGRITVDDLYDYAFEEISRATPNQTPTKSASKQAGEIVLRQITRLEDIKPVTLPDDLQEAVSDSRTFVREGSVEQLAKLLNGKNLGLFRSAKEALEKMASEDDSLRVRQAATRVLEPLRAAEKEAEELARQKAEPPPAPVVAPETTTVAVEAAAPIVVEDAAPAAVEAAVPLVAEAAVPVAQPPMAIEPAAPKEVESREQPGWMPLNDIGRGLRMRPAVFAGAGALVVIAVVAALAFRGRPAAPVQPGTTPLASVVSPTQAALAMPVTGSPAATALSTVVASTQAAGSVTAPAAVGTHLVQPVDVALKTLVTVYDTDSSGTGPQGRAPYGDSYSANRFERPFQKGMTYVPDLDILSFTLSQDATWNYFSMQLAGNNPNDPLSIDYGVEIDLNDDGYGDYLIWAHPSYAAAWQTSGIQVFKDTNHDTGSAGGNGYDTLIFNGGTSQDSDPDMAWVRMVSGTHASVQFALKRSAIASSFLWGAIADAGLKDVTKFDYRFQSTQADAGSPVRGAQYFPLGTLYAVDNTCWEPQNIRITGDELKVCPVSQQAGSKNGGGGSNCAPIQSGCPAGQHQSPVTCLCVAN